MSTDESFKPLRKKHNILWWIGGVFFLLILLFLLQLFGPNPPIIVSPQTTYITEPLGPDGLPDYEQYTLDLYRDGVTPENNAAVLLLQALWPAELDPSQYAAVVTELGLEQIPSKDEALVHLHDQTNQQRVAAWLRDLAKSQPRDAAESGETPDGEGTMRADPFGSGDDPYSSEAADSVIEHSMSRPWTSEQIPPLAKWIAENKKPLDLLLEASRRPRFHSPSPSLTDNKRGLLIQMLLPGIQSVREVGRSLSARAMWHVGEGHNDEAWQDLLALHRISRLVAQGHTLVEQFVAIAMSGIACDGTLTLLHHGNLTVDQARQVQRDLDALPSLAGIASSIDQGDRLSAIDAFVRVGSGGRSDIFSPLEMANPDFSNTALSIVSVDWNLVLRETNRWYDRMVAAARLPDRAARRTALDQVDGEIRQLELATHAPTRWLAGAISREQRSELVSAMTLSLFLPLVNAATNAEDRANNTLDLTRLAAALAVYRAEHGAYPEKLDDLVPGVLDKLPVDLYNAQPFIYQRDGEGYLLYSAGENGADDGGSSEMMTTLKGQSLNDLDPDEIERLQPQIPAGADDHSIRLPRPKFELPKIAPPTD